MQVPKRKSEEKVQRTPQDNLITQEKYDQLTRKLNRLVAQRPEQIKIVQRLAQEGDFSENVPYQMAKGKLRSLNNRILKTEAQLKYAEIIAPSADTSRVRIGHYVTVTVNGKERRYQILGSAETNPTTGIISRTSPLGEALLGKQVGQQVHVQAANHIVTYTITSIE